MKIKILNNLKHIKLLWETNKLHYNEIEEEYRKYLLFFDSNNLYVHTKKNYYSHFFNNMFSVLFYTTYYTMDFTEKERKFFGLLNNTYRFLVTSTDNILDDDNNHYYKFKKLNRSPHIESILDFMLSEKIISKILYDYCFVHKLITKQQIIYYQKELFNSFSRVGVNESEEIQLEQFDYTSKKIINNVHRIKSGDLFTLPYLIPGLYFKHKKATGKLDLIKKYKDAVYDLSIGIQVMDDIIDIKEDFVNKKPNYFLSLIDKKEIDLYKYIIEQNKYSIKNKIFFDYYIQSLKLIKTKFNDFYTKISSVNNIFDKQVYNFIVKFIFKKYNIPTLFSYYKKIEL